MADTVRETVRFTVCFDDPERDLEAREGYAQALMEDLRQMDGVEEVGRVLDPRPPGGNKAGGGFLAGVLMAEVSVANAKKVLGYVWNRWGGQPIELSVEKDGEKKKLTVKVNNRGDLDAAMRAAQDFLEG